MVGKIEDLKKLSEEAAQEPNLERFGTATKIPNENSCRRLPRHESRQVLLENGNGVVEPVPSIRFLVVDDFENWRHQIHSLLQARPAWEVVAEASDGPEAVQKAEDLKPDLILLDIGLSELDGIEAARQIQQRSPGSKIIFLSQNNDVDVVRAALATGALGYVSKIDAGHELLPAVESVLRGRQFVGRRFTGFEPIEI